MRILLLEDQPLEAESITASLERAFSGVVLDRVRTELEFRSRLDAITKDPPDIFIVDMMLPWTSVSEHMAEPPAEVMEGGYHRAGLRCQRLLAQQEETKDKTVIFYTVLERHDLDLKDRSANVFHLRKESDHSALIRLIRASYSATVVHDAIPSAFLTIRDQVLVS